jgi:hypothetical protein
MILLCKKFYPGLLDDKFQVFLKGKTYRLARNIFYHNENYYRVSSKDDKYTELFSQVRKEKLKRLNEEVK